MYVLEWCRDSNNLHVQQLAQSLESAQRAFTQNNPVRYVIIGTGTHAEMLALADQVRPIVVRRQRAIDRQEAA